MAGELGYFTIPTKDIERCKTFFAGLFDWTFAESSESYAHIAESAAPAGGLHAGGAVGRPKVWFRIDDVQAAVKRVRSLGGAAEEPSESATGWSSDCVDDQGAEFSLWQPAPGF